MTSVLLFTESPVLALGCKDVLGNGAKLELIGCCTRVDEILPMLKQMRPAVLLVDVAPQFSSPVLLQIRTTVPETRVVLWLKDTSPEFTWQAVELGVHGLLSSSLSPGVLVEALEDIAGGNVRFEVSMKAALRLPRRVRLTRREWQLVGHLCEGLKNKEIAEKLSLSEGTVKVYMSRLFRKTGVKDRFELALHGLRSSGEVGSIYVPERRGGAREDAAEEAPGRPSNVLTDRVSYAVRAAAVNV